MLRKRLRNDQACLKSKNDYNFSACKFTDFLNYVGRYIFVINCLFFKLHIVLSSNV